MSEEAASDGLSTLWGSVIDRYEYIRGLIVASAEGEILKTLATTALPALSGPMIAAVCREASKMRLGQVSSTTAFFEEIALFFVNLKEKSLILVFVLSPNANLGLVQALVPQFSALLSLRIER